MRCAQWVFSRRFSLFSCSSESLLGRGSGFGLGPRVAAATAAQHVQQTANGITVIFLRLVDGRFLEDNVFFAHRHDTEFAAAILAPQFHHLGGLGFAIARLGHHLDNPRNDPVHVVAGLVQHASFADELPADIVRRCGGLHLRLLAAILAVDLYDILVVEDEGVAVLRKLERLPGIASGDSRILVFLTRGDKKMDQCPRFTTERFHRELLHKRAKERDPATHRGSHFANHQSTIDREIAF